VSPGSDLAFALELADLADSISLPRFRASDLRVEIKPDLTPVTDADRAVERALRERISAGRPGEGVLGEEEGDDDGSVRWILDPIDGTKNFARGIPVWATLIALERQGELTVGVVAAPALGRRWWAARVAELGNASASCSLGPDLAALEPHVMHARGLGDFWQHVLVAEGALDAAIDARLALYDFAAFAPILREAGGRTSAPDGGEPRAGEQVVSSNGLLHDAVLALLADR